MPCLSFENESMEKNDEFKSVYTLIGMSNFKTKFQVLKPK
jgi:hypothetical protein